MKKIVYFVLSAVMAAALSLSLFSFSACAKQNEEKIQIYMPDGAPALSMAKLMSEDTDADDTEYRVVSANTIEAYVTGNAPAADLCVLPLNTASKLLGTGENYQLLGAVTHGNLYMLSVDGVELENGEDLQMLKGKKVGVIQIANIPGLTFKVILEQYGIEWQELTGNTEIASDKVNLQGIADPATGITPAGGCDYYIAAEPLVSVKTAATSLRVAGDLQSLYNGEQGYPQAVLVAKTDFIATHEEWIASFKAKMSVAADWLKTADTEKAVSAVASHLTQGLTPAFSEKNLSTSVISRCGIYFTEAKDCKAEITDFLKKLIAVNPNFASSVDNSFFYGADV